MRTAVGCAVALALTSPAFADSALLYPVQTGAEVVRFRTGIPTLNLETETGAIQITPLPFDHGHVTFGIGVYNKGKEASNLGIENISAAIAGQNAVVLSSQELQKRAKSRATWSMVGMALLAGAAAAASANAHTTETYRGRVTTPHGTYSWVSSYRDNSIGALGAGVAVAGGAVAINGIQNRLDWTLSNLATDIVQTTTIDPDSSYGGRIVLEKSDKAKLPYDVRVVITFNGTPYPFVFRVTKPGVSVPPPYTVAPATAASMAPPAPAPAKIAPEASSELPVNKTPS